MCGICGVAGLEDKALVERMRDSMVYRGPDDKGVYVSLGISLGHRRLSIIDLSPAGHQPMSNEDGSVWVVYNGETYNYKELRSELEKRGHIFKSESDTEVLVHAYEEYGPEFMAKTRGQCAVAIWDSKRKRLVLARDRLGIKPLYYTMVDGMLFFASEMKALLAYEKIKPEVNYRALDNYLTFQYVPEPESIFKGIFKVLPGEVIVYEGGRMEKRRYWDLDLSRKSQGTQSGIISELSRRLTESVGIELVSDVPLGVHLSGGIDSSAIAAIMTGLVKEPVKTFSVGYGSEKLDELSHAKVVAEYLNTDHQEVIVGANEVVGELDDIVWHLDEPIGDPGILPQYFLAKHTKKKVTVVFNGAGSDEIFAGYRAYSYLLRSERLRSLPGFLRSAGAGVAGMLPLPANYRRYVEYIGESEEEKTYWGQGLLFDEGERKGLYSDSLTQKTKGNNPAGEIRKFLQEKKDSAYKLNNFLYVDIKGWLTDNCTMLLDKVMMAHAVECRVPFLDYRLVEYAMTIPPELKIHNGVEKYVLRKALEGKLPESTIHRPKKGFGVPTDTWLFKDVNDAITNRLSSSEFIKQNFNKDKIDFLLKGTKDFRHSHQLFGLLVLDIWHEKYLRSQR